MSCGCTGLSLVSLFDGIGGFPLSFSRAGVPTVATVEIDKAAAGVAADHFPEAKSFSDVTEVTPDDLLGTGFCPVHGILTAGWPCTDLSLAGLRLGLGGARSGLVGEVFRLLLGVRPRWFVLENVPGLLSSVCPCPGGGACGAGCTAAHVVRGGSCGRAVRRGTPYRPGRCMEGMASPTECWTLSTSESPSVGVASSLSDILETGPVPPKYSLSPKSATGILRRAARRGRVLRGELERELTALAAKWSAPSD
jgi:hypothetical protein